MDNLEKLEKLYLQYSNCQNCNLSKDRTNIVFGEGNSKTGVIFIGEAPGHNEDIEGSPFCGAAGHLLNNYLDLIGAHRKDIYITNVVKCRPPNNRNPYVGEIKSCKIILDSQLEIISPAIIVTLGNVATKAFLNLKDGISELRGRWFQKDKYRILPMFHPAALLRDPEKKKDTSQDFEILKREFNLWKNKELLNRKISLDKSKKL